MPTELRAIHDAVRQLGQIVAHYRRDHWVLLRNLISPAFISTYLCDVLNAPSKRVTVGEGVEWWTQHAIEAGSSLGQFLNCSLTLELASTAAGRALRKAPVIWAQVYEVGQMISWHRDGGGDIQFLLCLQAPSQQCGGTFCMRLDESDVQIQLQAGDAVLFRATDILHSTTRLVVGREEPQPRRVTAVARFFAEQNIPTV
jgi:hypothetical protein